MKEPLYIIDGTSYIFRAYYAIGPLTNSKGVHTNATLGFTKMILKFINDFKPQHIAMVFDAKEKTFRHKLYPEYKANRVTPPEDLIEQIPYIQQISYAMQLPTFIVPGFEADDIISTIANKYKENTEIIIVSGDKDLMQLVDNKIHMYDPMKNKKYDPVAVREKMGVPPSGVRDYLAIKGDSSDNIPGVHGIGVKGAEDLILRYENLDAIYEHIEEVKGNKKKQLIEQKDKAYLSQKLVTLDSNVPIDCNFEKLKFNSFNIEELKNIFRELEFKTLYANIDKPKEETNNQQQANEQKTDKQYHCISSEDELNKLVKALEAADTFAFDTETTALEPRKAELVGISFSLKSNEAYYIPLTHNYIGVPQQLPVDLVLNKIKPILNNKNKIKIGQNIKYDLIVLGNYGLTFPIDMHSSFFDTLLASFILYPDLQSHSLDFLSFTFLNHETIKYEDVTGSGRNQISFSEVTIEKATEYASEDADCTYALYLQFKNEIDKHPCKNIFYDIEMPLMLVITEMEKAGVSIDTNFLKSLSVSYQHDINKLQTEIHSIAGEPFNIKSTKQLSYILFEKLGLEPISKLRDGFSTKVEVLEKLANKHPIAKFLLNFRELTKLKNTYIDTLPELIIHKTGKIHTSFNQTATVTGRLSSSNPNLQNIPIRTPRGEQIRKAFIPSSNENCLLSADYSQIELRIMAHIANDSAFIEDFYSGEDIHKKTAIRVYNLTEATYSSDYRRKAKAINFGLIYGMGPYALSQNLNITQAEAKKLIDIYFEKHSGVKKYMVDTIASAKSKGYVETLFGRRRYFKAINQGNKNIQRNSERAAINAPIQGTSADIIKMAMINIHPKLAQYKAQMLMQVHDELVFELPNDAVKEFQQMVIHEMETVVKLKVPLLVNVATGKNWLEAH